MTPPCERGAGVESLTDFDDDDITIDSPIHARQPKLYRAVFRALTRLWGHYDLLIQERAAQRICQIETLAEDCIREWSLAQAALLKLEQIDGHSSGHVESARVAVDGAAHLLQPHLRPTARMPAPARKRLVWLRLVLRSAMRERNQGRKTASAP